jgi:hypothetical protein
MNMHSDEGRVGLDSRLEQLGAWSGIAWVICAGAGFGGSGLLPVQAASTAPAELAGYLSDMKHQILIGMLMLLIGGFTFLLTWSMTLAYQVRKYADPSPMAFYVLFAAGMIGAIIGMLCGVIGSAMAFRVDTLSPDTTQLLYDLIWFLFLIPWPPFMLWQLVTGFAILSDRNTGVMFPRWIGYFSLWAAALEIFSALSVFFYDGPFSYNGLVTFWVPGVSFFVWVLVFAVVQIRGWPRVQEDSPQSAVDKAASDALGAESAPIPESAVI